jgi:uncharacterized protein YbbC (DUF1343 family)
MSKLSALYLFLAMPLSHARTAISTGAKVLYESDFAELRGKRVGLVTNHTAMVDGTHLIDMMHAGGVQLVAIFAPEHGLRGLQEDGASIGDGIDKQTGVHVYSLYGRVEKPTPEMLRGLDLLLFDIQSIGTRFYTYISTMGLAMQAASAAHVPFVVLDRPNPLGGEYFAGPVLEESCGSFVGEYPIPVVHGLTIGELALMIKGEHMLPGLEELDLRVIRMEGWQRAMIWPETGLEWVRTSPNIPDFETALLYPGICFLEGTAASVGRGTREPFKLVGFPGIDTGKLAVRLNGKHLPGVRFESVLFTPRSIPGMSSNPKFRDREIAGLRIIITNSHAYKPVTTGIHLLCALYGILSKEDRGSFFQQSGFDELAGTKRLRRSIEEGSSAEEIIADWAKGEERFAEKRRKYLLY